MNDIAQAVGIKAASLYAHFKGKEELFRAVLGTALETWSRLVQGIFERAEAQSDLAASLDLVLGDFACAMIGSVEYRFWARVYVFPPQVLGPEDLREIVAMDRSFAARLGELCARRLPRTLSTEALEVFCSSLAYFAMGIMMYAELMDEASIRAEIHRGVAFHLKALGAGEAVS